MNIIRTCLTVLVSSTALASGLSAAATVPDDPDWAMASPDVADTPAPGRTKVYVETIDDDDPDTPDQRYFCYLDNTNLQTKGSKGGMYVDASLPGDEFESRAGQLRFWFVEASQTVDNPYPMGAELQPSDLYASDLTIKPVADGPNGEKLAELRSVSLDLSVIKRRMAFELSGFPSGTNNGRVRAYTAGAADVVTIQRASGNEVFASNTNAATVHEPRFITFDRTFGSYRDLNHPDAVYPRAVPSPSKWAKPYAVAFAKDFWICEREVSQRLWNELFGAPPSNWPIRADREDAGYPDYPWAFDDMTPTAYEDADGVYSEAQMRDWFSNAPVAFVTHDDVVSTFLPALASAATFGSDVPRLPTESEWELAARSTLAWGGADWPSLAEREFEKRVPGGYLVTEGDPPKPKKDRWDLDPMGKPDWNTVANDPALFAAVDNLVVRPGSTMWVSDWSSKFISPGPGSGVDAMTYYKFWIGYHYDYRNDPPYGDPSGFVPFAPGDASGADFYLVTNLEASWDKPWNPSGLKNADLELRLFDFQDRMEPKNDWGIWHMHGNVAEMTRDKWDGQAPYNTLAASDSGNPSWFPDLHGNVDAPADGNSANTVGRFRVIRGGSYFNNYYQCAASYRSTWDDTQPSDQVGFRILVEDNP